MSYLIKIRRRTLWKKINLSSLEGNTLVPHADYPTPFSVQELRVLLKEGEATTEEWYITEEHSWIPDARHMLDNYIENERENPLL